MIRHQLRGKGRWVVAIAVLVAGALAAIGYILSEQHFRFPWQDRYTLYAEFASTAGLEGGLGQPVDVAGVRVGTIRGVRLDDGRAVAELEIDPGRLPAVYRDAHALLVPTSALKDLRIELVPGRRGAGTMRSGATIPVARTTSPVDADGLLSALDRDTRDFLAVLIGESGRATAGRGNDLRRLLGALGPTVKDLRPLARTLARRQAALRRLVGNLAAIGRRVAPLDADVSRLVRDAGTTAAAVAREQDALDRSLRLLPATLAGVRDTAEALPAFGAQAGRTLRAVRPTIDALPRALDALEPAVRPAPRIIAEQLRPAVRALRPVVRDLASTVPALSRVTPHLSSAFRVLTYTVNELGYNPPGDDEGLLYWLAWSAHNSNSVAGMGDAHGGTARAVAMVDCGTLTEAPQLSAVAGALLGPILPSCPEAGR